ncbi:hypothetical protein E6H23_09355 [Candidatus Bathyarchaeota archaeon]|nr:MAG: hypothetical protein E6H23_09355 [Candidatus Bathyarchaeota archaeon]
MSSRTPRCSCGGELVIVGDIRAPDGWRTGFKLQCKNCNAHWTYSGGFYHRETDTSKLEVSPTNPNKS